MSDCFPMDLNPISTTFVFSYVHCDFRCFHMDQNLVFVFFVFILVHCVFDSGFRLGSHMSLCGL